MTRLSQPLKYTGIGSRKIPSYIVDDFETWGWVLGTMNFILRSGGADGADTAFESGANTAGADKEIYLPWKGFNRSHSPLYDIPRAAFEIAADIYGSSWPYIKQSTKNFMARNMLQVMGLGLDEPSEFVICWTPDGCETAPDRTRRTGGTGQAIAYAHELEIPIYNFQIDDREADFANMLLEKYVQNQDIAKL